MIFGLLLIPNCLISLFALSVQCKTEKSTVTVAVEKSGKIELKSIWAAFHDCGRSVVACTNYLKLLDLWLLVEVVALSLVLVVPEPKLDGVGEVSVFSFLIVLKQHLLDHPCPLPNTKMVGFFGDRSRLTTFGDGRLWGLVVVGLVKWNALPLNCIDFEVNHGVEVGGAGGDRVALRLLHSDNMSLTLLEQRSWWQILLNIRKIGVNISFDSPVFFLEINKVIIQHPCFGIEVFCCLVSDWLQFLE